MARCSRNGASSGLHHDFHDNLYVLLRGRKVFRLFPPDKAPRMYTHGTLRTVHANGRIVYEGQVRRSILERNTLRALWSERSASNNTSCVYICKDECGIACAAYRTAMF